MAANNDNNHQLELIEKLFSKFRQTIPIASLSTSIRSSVHDTWLLETLDLLRYLHTMNQQYVNEYTKDNRHPRDTHKLKTKMKNQIELAYSMLDQAERTCPFSASSWTPQTTPNVGRIERRAMATEDEKEDEYYLDPVFRQNLYTLLHAIRNYADETCSQFLRWLDHHPNFSSSAHSSVEEKDLIYDIFLAPLGGEEEEDDDDDEPLIQSSEIGYEHDAQNEGADVENAVALDASIPNYSQNQQRQTVSSHPPNSGGQTPTPPVIVPAKKDVALDPIQFQKQQQELLEEELASMASRLKSSTLAMNATLQSQAKDLDSMEQLAQSNLDQVTHTTKDVEGRLAKKRGWKKQLATWSLIGTVVGMWIICFMVMRTVPKRTIGKVQMLHRRGGEKKQEWSWGIGTWRECLSNAAGIFSSKLDEEQKLNGGGEQRQEEKLPQQSILRECEIQSDGIQVCINEKITEFNDAERRIKDLKEEAARLEQERAVQMKEEKEAAKLEQEKAVAERKRMQEEETEAARLEQERAAAERRRIEGEEEAARLEQKREEAERKRMEEEQEAARLEQERQEAERKRMEEEEEEAARLEQEIEEAERERIQDEEKAAVRLVQERQEAERRRMEEEQEAARLEQERQEAERKRMEEKEETARIELEKGKAERKRIEEEEEEGGAARLEQERREAEHTRMEEEEEEAAMLEQEREEAERYRIEEEEGSARLRQERQEAERTRMEEEKVEAARLEQERQEAERKQVEEGQEAARFEQERQEAERKRMEEEEVEAARLKKKKKEAERKRIDGEEEAARLEQEREEAERKRMEEEEEEAARMEQEKGEAERKLIEEEEEVEEAARLEQEREDAEHRLMEEEEVEAARLEQENEEAERKRIEEEEEAARLEQEREEAELRRVEEEQEAARLVQEREKAERKRIQEEEKAAVRLEQEREEAEVRQMEEEQEAARLEQEREEAERKRIEEEEAARLERGKEVAEHKLEEENVTRKELKQIETETAITETKQEKDAHEIDPDRNAENDVDVSNSLIFTPADVRIAAARSENDLLSRYISASPETIDASDRGGWRPIHEAVRAGNIAGVQLLILAGCDLTTRTGRSANGGTALWWAIQRFGEDHDIVQLLRSHGALEAGPTT